MTAREFRGPTPGVVWAVLRTAASDADALAHWNRVLRRELDGVVAVGHGPGPNGSCPRVDAGPAHVGALGCLLAGLRAVPDEAACIAFLTDEALVSVGASVVGEMLSWLDDDVAAVVRVTPVTDALKRVADDVIVGAVDRSRLLIPQTPQILRRDALDDALLALPDGGLQDPAALLLATGHAVRAYRLGAPGGRARSAWNHVAR